MVYNKLLSKLSQNLLEDLDDDKYYDITIDVGNNPYTQIFCARMVIFSIFAEKVCLPIKKNDETLVHIKLPNILPKIFQAILRYSYDRILSLDEYDTSDIIKILIMASEFSLQELTNHLQTYLIEHEAN
ncbi:hypothetical protein C1645_740076 [Glomus cerebriforme]|uniref:BTB domain-containing protein n=1 Tax=Glomus cerebriforme TaxID=658196 RepID=A0A397SMU2_9GLOM|nr:hypothetical protein C1645_740076 [Glomus cerebriforme]